MRQGEFFHKRIPCTLITYCLDRQIFVIDDLAYQNVAPIDHLPEIKTVRQIAAELVGSACRWRLAPRPIDYCPLDVELTAWQAPGWLWLSFR
jgi:hypothetical protein